MRPRLAAAARIASALLISFALAWVLVDRGDLWMRRIVGEPPAERASSRPVAAEEVRDDLGAIPVPPGVVETFVLRKPDRWGGRFQGMYEGGGPPEAVIAFYEGALVAEGWRCDTALEDAFARVGERHRAWSRGGRRFLLSLYPRADGGSDFRVSALSRPERRGPGAGAQDFR